MNLKKQLLGALSFAHLASIGSVRAATDDEKDDKKDDVDMEDEKPGDTEQDREDGDSKESGKAKSEDEKDEEKADDDDKEYKDTDPQEADDDDPDEEMRGKSATAKARRRERARCAAIFADAAAGRNPVLAANLAFNTSMSRTEALAVLRSTPAGAQRSRHNPDLGADSRVTPSRASADRMAEKMKQAAGR